MNTNTPPQAKRVPHTHEIHGDVREDPYYWLRERDNPDVVAYLEAENAYLKAAGPSQALQDALYQEMFGRIQQVDLSVPVKDGPYWYGSRTVEGQQYKVYYRKRAESRAALEQATEEVLLDLNALAAQHAFLKLSILQVTPDHRILAYSLDTDGSANNTFYFKDLETGEVLPDQLTNTESYGSLVWAADSRTVFYLQMDQTHRPYALMRHTLGTDPNTDECLYREQDDSYVLFLNRSQDREYLFLNCSSKLTTEQHWLRSEDPNGQWQVFAPRQHNILYHLEHAQGRFLVHTNENAINFKLMGAPVGNTTAQNASREGWETIIEHRESVLLEGVQPFANHWLVPVREGGLARVWVRDRDGQTRALEFDEPVSTVHIADNREFDTNEFNVLFDSMSTPYTIWGFRFDTLERTPRDSAHWYREVILRNGLAAVER